MKVVCMLLLLAVSLAFFACGAGSKSTPTPPATLGGTGGTGGTGGSGGSGGGGTGGGGTATTAALAYTVGPNDASISGIRVASNNTAAPVGASPFNSPSPVRYFAMTDKFLFASNFQNSVIGQTTITTYSIDANGGLASVSSTNLQGGGFIRVDPSGQFLYAAQWVQQAGDSFGVPAIYGYSISANGALLPVPGSPWIPSAGETIGPLAVSSTNVCADFAAGHANDLVFCYPRRSDGSLDIASGVMVNNTNGVTDMAFSPDGSRLFMAGNSGVSVANMNAPTAPPTTLSAVGSFAAALAVDPSGQWLVVSNPQNRNISVFNLANTNATAGPTVSTSGVPGPVAFSKTGAYVFASTDAGVEVYSFDTTGGALTPLSGSPVSGNSAGQIAAR